MIFIIFMGSFSAKGVNWSLFNLKKVQCLFAPKVQRSWTHEQEALSRLVSWNDLVSMHPSRLKQHSAVGEIVTTSQLRDFALSEWKALNKSLTSKLGHRPFTGLLAELIRELSTISESKSEGSVLARSYENAIRKTLFSGKSREESYKNVVEILKLISEEQNKETLRSVNVLLLIEHDVFSDLELQKRERFKKEVYPRLKNKMSFLEFTYPSNLNVERHTDSTIRTMEKNGYGSLVPNMERAMEIEALLWNYYYFNHEGTFFDNNLSNPSVSFYEGLMPGHDRVFDSFLLELLHLQGIQGGLEKIKEIRLTIAALKDEWIPFVPALHKDYYRDELIIMGTFGSESSFYWDKNTEVPNLLRPYEFGVFRSEQHGDPLDNWHASQIRNGRMLVLRVYVNE